MGITFNSVTLPNPVNVNSDSQPVTAANVVYNQLVTYDHTLLDARMYVHTFQFQWGGLSATELDTIRAQWRIANDDYVVLAMDGLAIISFGFMGNDNCEVIVQEGTGLDVTFGQGWNSNGEGPILYDVTATFVSSPQVDT